MTVLTALERNDNCKKIYSIGWMLKVIYLLFSGLGANYCYGPVFSLHAPQLHSLPRRDRANILRLECMKAFSSIRQSKD